MFSIKRKKRSKILKITPNYGNRLYDITSLIELKIREMKLLSGLVNIHIQASTAAIMIQENGESHLKKEFINFFQQLISSYLSKQYILDINNDARLKASIIGPGKTIPVIKGKLALAKCQRIFLCEFDQSNIQREILITSF